MVAVECPCLWPWEPCVPQDDDGHGGCGAAAHKTQRQHGQPAARPVRGEGPAEHDDPCHFARTRADVGPCCEEGRPAVEDEGPERRGVQRRPADDRRREGDLTALRHAHERCGQNEGPGEKGVTAPGAGHLAGVEPRWEPRRQRRPERPHPSVGHPEVQDPARGRGDGAAPS